MACISSEPETWVLGLSCSGLSGLFLLALSPLGYRSLPGIQLGIQVCDGSLTSTLLGTSLPIVEVTSLISLVEGTDCLSHQLRKGISLVLCPGHLGAAMSRHWSSRLNSDPDSLDYSSFSQGIDSIFSLTARLFLEDCPVGQTVLHARTPHLILTSDLYPLTCLNEGPFTP